MLVCEWGTCFIALFTYLLEMSLNERFNLVMQE